MIRYRPLHIIISFLVICEDVHEETKNQRNTLIKIADKS